MKKLYKSPLQKVVELGTEGLIASSEPNKIYKEEEIDAQDILSREVSSTSLWDNEW